MSAVGAPLSTVESTTSNTFIATSYSGSSPTTPQTPRNPPSRPLGFRRAPPPSPDGFVGGLPDHRSLRRTCAGSAAPVFECPPAPDTIRLDGDLAEWQALRPLEIGEAQLVRRAADWSGPADLSGRIWVCRSATTLYFAGEVRDETLFWNPDVTVRGDGVELFLDFNPEGTRRETDGYDKYVHQLLLHPLASEVRWTFAQFRGRAGRMDDPVDGVDLAGARWQDEQGTTLGYRFELALPLSNFPSAPTRSGAGFGFDVALSDSDGLPQQESYGTWSGHADLAVFPARFGRMVLGAEPPEVPGPERPFALLLLPIAFLSSVFGLLLFAWLARGLDARDSRLASLLGRLSALRLRWKLLAAATLIGLIAVASAAASVAGSVLRDSDLESKREIAALVRSIDEEGAELGLNRPQPPILPVPLIGLLRGTTVKSPVDYDAVVLPALVVGEDGVAVPEPPHRTLDGVPFLRRDVPASGAWSDAFLVTPAVTADAVTLISSWRADPGQTTPLAQGTVVASLRVVHQDGKTAGPFDLRWGQHVDASDTPVAPAHPTAPEAAIAYVDGPLHADQTRFALSASEAPVVRVEVQQSAPGGRFTIHGVTLHSAPSGEPVPLALGRATRGGIPTAAPAFPPEGGGLVLSRDQPRITVPCDARADRIWIVASLRRGFQDERFGLPVATIRPEFDDGSSDSPFRLENGLDLDAETTPVRQHGADFRSEVAFAWGLPDEPRRHLDVATLVLEKPGRRLVKLHFEFKGEDEILRIASIVLGSTSTAPRPAKTEKLESTEGGWRLAPAHVAALAGIEFTAFRDGGAVATTVEGPARDRTLARALTPDQTLRIQRATGDIHDVRDVDGRELHVLSFAVRGALVEMSWTTTVDDRIGAWVMWLRLVFGVLLAPLAVMIAADVIQRMRSLHARLVAVCAATAAVPVVLGFFAVPEILASRIEEAQRTAVLEKLAAVKERLNALRSDARRHASRAIADEALQEALRRRGTPEFKSGVTAALRDLDRKLLAEAGPGARVAVDISSRTSPGDRIVFPQDLRWTVFRDMQSMLSDELAFRWSRLIARGRAQSYDTEGTWCTTLVVELAVDANALRAAATAAGGDAQVLLYTPRGYPLAFTGPAAPGEETQQEMDRKQVIRTRVLDDSRPAIESRVLGGTLHTVAYDVLRDEAGVVCLLAAAVPRDGAEALLSRVSYVALIVFGAAAAAQFLLVGLVAVGSTRPWARLVERAGGDAPTAEGRPDVAVVESAIAQLTAERTRLESLLGRLAEEAPDAARGADVEQIAEHATKLVRAAEQPWGAVVVVPDADGRMRVAAGFRGGETVPSGPLPFDPASPLAAAFRGRGIAHVPSFGAVTELVSREERRLLEGAGSVHAFPLSGPEGRGGALLVMRRPPLTSLPADGAPAPAASQQDGARPLAPSDDRFLEALARRTGLALDTSRLYRMAVRDPETGAHVASWFRERLREEVDRAVAAKSSIALVIVGAGASPGDAPAVRAAAQRLAERLRSLAPDRAFLGRLEPLVFALGVPESDRNAADEIAAHVRRAAAENELAALRLRVGIAACPQDAGSSEFLQAEARRSLAGDGREPTAADTAHAAVEAAATAGADQLVAEARRLGAVVVSPEGRALLESVERIASSDLTLLIQGETGTGKEVLADLVHRRSARRSKPFVKVNCAALPDALLESELFGYERGAFTGADRSKPGRFELADGGTLFLDEIGEMPLATQAKILRVLEDRTIEHLGGTRGIPVDVRIVAATNRELARAVAEGRFREDLYYRLNAVGIAIPPLRARKADIPVLAESFLRAAAEARGRSAPSIAPDAMDLLFRHDWPGNVRELRNLMEQAAVMFPGPTLRAADLAPSLAGRPRVRPVGADPAPQHSTGGVASPGAGGSAPGAAHDADRDPGMSDRQRRLLALMAERTWITTTEYCEIVGVSPRTALRDVRELVENGTIVMEGKRRGARYRLK